MIRGRNVVLRGVYEEDLQPLMRMRNDFSLQRQLMAVNPTLHDEKKTREWLERRCSDPCGAFFVIADTIEDMCCGFVQLTRIGGGAAFVGICLAPECQGNGFGKEALALIEPYAGSRGVHTLRLEVLLSNVRARTLYERLGYRAVFAGAEACVMEKAA